MKDIARNVSRFVLYLFFSTCVLHTAHALDTSFTNSYSGNFNGGATDTLYHGGNKLILIQVDDIPIPIVTGPPNYGFAIVDGDTTQETIYPINHLGLGNLSKENYNLHIGDFDDDGKDDLFFQSRSASVPHYIIFATVNGDFNSYTIEIYGEPVQKDPVVKSWNDGYLGINLSNASISITDFDGDGKMISRLLALVAVLSRLVQILATVFPQQPRNMSLWQIMVN